MCLLVHAGQTEHTGCIRLLTLDTAVRCSKIQQWWKWEKWKKHEHGGPYFRKQRYKRRKTSTEPQVTAGKVDRFCHLACKARSNLTHHLVWGKNSDLLWYIKTSQVETKRSLLNIIKMLYLMSSTLLWGSSATKTTSRPMLWFIISSFTVSVCPTNVKGLGNRHETKTLQSAMVSVLIDTLKH